MSRAFLVCGHLFISALCVCAGAGGIARADGWAAVVPDIRQTPPRLVAVDKASQTLSLVARQSPLTVYRQYDCTTGQIPGDKIVRGDLRTPEGVYFVVSKIEKGLDFTEYGGIAYPLNYPNPVDILRNKTGYGIWLHGRGKKLEPLSTQGCVAMDLPDIMNLGPFLTPGMAVVLAENVTAAAGAAPADRPENAIASLLEDKTKQWNSAWAGRSSDMFAMYDPQAYSKANQLPFAAFRAQKERLFATLPWIHIVYRDINVLQGPDYWVTWFEQYYRAPNITTEGIRRLYWQPDAEGELRIVGMEWLPQNLGLEAAYLETITPGVTTFVESWRNAWYKADVRAYGGFYAENARQGTLAGRGAIMDAKRQLWKRLKPVQVDISGLRVMLDQQGVRVDMTQIYKDSLGRGDKGVKTLVLRPQGESWGIVSETWSVR